MRRAATSAVSIRPASSTSRADAGDREVVRVGEGVSPHRRRVDRARPDRHHPVRRTAVLELAAYRAHPLLHRCLPRAVAGAAGERHPRRGRRDHHEPAFHPAGQVAQEHLAEQQRRRRVGEHVTPVRGRVDLADEPCGLGQERVVHEHRPRAREPGELAGEVPLDRVPPLRVRQVGPHALERRVRPAGDADHAGARPRHGRGERLADPARGAGDPDDRHSVPIRGRSTSSTRMPSGSRMNRMVSPFVSFVPGSWNVYGGTRGTPISISASYAACTSSTAIAIR